MKRYRILVLVFTLLALAYLLETVVLPPDSASLSRYQLTATQAKLLGMTVVLPVITVWFIGLYGYTKLHDYAKAIGNEKDGVAWRNISGGLMALILWLSLSTVLTNLASYFYHRDTSLAPTLIILANYMNMAFIIYGLWAIHDGAKKLTLLSKPYPKQVWPAAYTLIFAAASTLFIFLTMHNPVRQFPNGNARFAAYYLPDPLLIATIVVPYIIVWYLGIRSVQYIHAFSRNVKGRIYKKALRYLANGLAFVVVSLILIRYLVGILGVFQNTTLKSILLLLYWLVFMIALGNILIALGAKRLIKIEEA